MNFPSFEMKRSTSEKEFQKFAKDLKHYFAKYVKARSTTGVRRSIKEEKNVHKRWADYIKGPASTIWPDPYKMLDIKSASAITSIPPAKIEKAVKEGVIRGRKVRGTKKVAFIFLEDLLDLVDWYYPLA